MDLQIDDLEPINLESYDKFIKHPSIIFLMGSYNDRYVLAKQAAGRLMKDLISINETFRKDNNKIVFTHIEGRAKELHSFFRKIYKICSDDSRVNGVTPQIITNICAEVKDICGVRFACAYYDEVESVINEIIRPQLLKLNYAVDLQSKDGFEDRNYLDDGNEVGYRSYHFYVRVPTPIDIFGQSELCLCEVQGRTELQHVWASKSHSLLYKDHDGWNLDDPDIIEDMRQLSNSLRSADHALSRIRRRVEELKK